MNQIKQSKGFTIAGCLGLLTLTWIPAASYSDSLIESGQSSGQQAVITGACNIQRGQINLGPIALCQNSGNNLLMQQASPQGPIQSETIAITSSYGFINKINNRLQKLKDCSEDSEQKEGTKGKRRKDCRGRPGASGGGGAVDGYSFIGPFGVSISGGGGFGDQNDAGGQTGFKVDTQHFTGIADYTFNDQLIGGFSFGYQNSQRNFSLNSGTLNSDAYRFSPFLNFSPTPESYITLLGGYSRLEYDSTRSLSPAINPDSTKNATFSNATAKYGEDQFFASLGTGYTYRWEAWSLRGYARGDYSHTYIEGFTENGANVFKSGSSSPIGNVALNVNSQNFDSVTSTLGMEVSHAFSTPTIAAVVIPSLRAEWVHEYENGSRTVNSSFIGAQALGPITTAGPIRDWANLGVGLQMQFPQNLVGFLNYETLFIQNGSNQIVSGGLRMNF